MGPSTLFRYENFSARGVRGRSAPGVNLGPPHISETVRARKSKFYTHFDRAKYSFRYENISARGRAGSPLAGPSVIFVNENKNGEKRENNECVNEN